MADITLDQFRAISNGSYNAGQIDFTTNDNGEVTGLKKVNHHVNMKFLNTDSMDVKRVVAIKEAFIKALARDQNANMSAVKIAQIRARLGIPESAHTTIAGAGDALKRRYTPLTRQQVREILRKDVDVGAQANHAVDSENVINVRNEVNGKSLAQFKNDPASEQLFAILSGRSLRESVDAAVQAGPNMLELKSLLEANPRDPDLRASWNRVAKNLTARAANTLVALRLAGDALLANPNAPTTAKTPFGDIRLMVAHGLGQTSILATVRLGDESITIDLGCDMNGLVGRLDGQIEGAAELVGKDGLRGMLVYAVHKGAVADGNDPCFARTVAKTILRQFTDIGDDVLDETSNSNIVRYAMDVVYGAKKWTAAMVAHEIAGMIQNQANVNIIAEVMGIDVNEQPAGEEALNPAVQGNEQPVIEDALNLAVQNDAQPVPPNEVQPVPPNEVQPVPPNEVQPVVPGEEQPVVDNQDGAQVEEKPPKYSKDSNDLIKFREAPNMDEMDAFAAKLQQRREERLAAEKRAAEKRAFENVAAMFPDRKDRQPVGKERFNDAAPKVNSADIEVPNHFLAISKTENFRFSHSNLSQKELSEVRDFAEKLTAESIKGNVEAVKRLLADHVREFLMLAADPKGGAAFFPDVLVASPNGFDWEWIINILASNLKDIVAKEMTLNFQSFSALDEKRLAEMFGRKDEANGILDRFAKSFVGMLERGALSFQKMLAPPAAEKVAEAQRLLGGVSADKLLALAKTDPLALVTFAAGEGAVEGLSAVRSADVKASVVNAILSAAGKNALGEVSINDWENAVASGALNDALVTIAAQNRLFRGEMYDATAGSAEKRLNAASTRRTDPAKPAEGSKRLEPVGGITLHISEMFEENVPRPSRTTPADLRNLVADMLGVAVNIRKGGFKGGCEDMRRLMLDKIDFFCRFLESRRAVNDAVMPAIRGIVNEAMDKVKAVIDDALVAKFGKHLGEFRPLAIRNFIKDNLGAHELEAIVKAFVGDPADKNAAGLVEKSATTVQKFVNDTCGLKPEAEIASEYDKMSPEAISDSLSGKSLDDILDDPLKNPKRPSMLAFQKKVLSTYFTTISFDRKLDVITSALRNAPDAKPGVEAETKFLGAIFLGAGPLMQKALQGIDKRIAGDHCEAFAVLKSSIPPIPEEYINAKLDEMVANNSHMYKSIVKIGGKKYKTLGAATVGQAVKCCVKMGKAHVEEIIVKIRRPGVKERFDEDVAIFNAVAKKVPSVSKAWAHRVKTIEEEFDFRNEAKNIATGIVYEVADFAGDEDDDAYSNTNYVSAMKVPKGVKQTEDVLIGSVAPGEPLDKVIASQTRSMRGLFAGVFETDADGAIRRVKGRPVIRKDMNASDYFKINASLGLEVKGVSLSALFFKQVIWKWIDEALFKSGVMHNDVHTGNIMIEDRNNEKRATFIDFGNIVKLTEKERELLLKMVTAVASKHKGFFVETFINLMFGEAASDAKKTFKNSDLKKKLDAVVASVIDKGLTAPDTGYRFQAILSEISKLGIDIPPQVATFVEGLTRLQNCHEELCDLLAETQSLFQEYQAQVVCGEGIGVERDEFDAVGKLLDVMLDPTVDKDRKEPGPYRDAYERVKQMAGFADGFKPQGWLIDEMKKAFEEEKDSARNTKVEKLASYVIRHASEANVWAIRGKLDNLNHYKAKLFSARARGATDKIADYEHRIESAKNELLSNVADAVQTILQSADETVEENPNPVYTNDFITMTAAEVFADIVHANMDAVMKCFGGKRLFGLGAIFGGGVSISSALKSAVAKDKDHKTDGHKKVSANKL